MRKDILGAIGGAVGGGGGLTAAAGAGVSE
jgi:hypothetical protein